MLEPLLIAFEFVVAWLVAMVVLGTARVVVDILKGDADVSR